LKTYEASEITDELMKRELEKAKEYSLVILKTTPGTFTEEAAPIIWEHGRRNFALRADGVLSIVCPAGDRGEVAGIGIFAGSVDDVRAIMREDPAVESGVLGFEVHPIRGFPGDRLPD
jgi:hypothetical protein